MEICEFLSGIAGGDLGSARLRSKGASSEQRDSNVKGKPAAGAFEGARCEKLAFGWTLTTKRRRRRRRWRRGVHLESCSRGSRCRDSGNPGVRVFDRGSSRCCSAGHQTDSLVPGTCAACLGRSTCQNQNRFIVIVVQGATKCNRQAVRLRRLYRLGHVVHLYDQMNVCA